MPPSLLNAHCLSSLSSNAVFSEDKRAPRQVADELNAMGPSMKRYEFSEFRNMLKGLIASKGGDPGTAHVKPLRFSLGG